MLRRRFLIAILALPAAAKAVVAFRPKGRYTDAHKLFGPMKPIYRGPYPLGADKTYLERYHNKQWEPYPGEPQVLDEELLNKAFDRMIYTKPQPMYYLLPREVL